MLCLEQEGFHVMNWEMLTYINGKVLGRSPIGIHDQQEQE